MHRQNLLLTIHIMVGRLDKINGITTEHTQECGAPASKVGHLRPRVTQLDF